MADRTVQPLRDSQMGLTDMIVFTIDNPSAGDYYIIERSNFNFYVTNVKAIVTATSGTPSIDVAVKRNRDSVETQFKSLTSVNGTLQASALNATNGNGIINDADTAGESFGDGLFVTIANVTDVDQVKVELDIVIGTKEVTT